MFGVTGNLLNKRKGHLRVIVQSKNWSGSRMCYVPMGMYCLCGSCNESI